MNNAVVDRKTLAWVKAEIEETLKSVYHEPDVFAKNVEDLTPIQACIEPLRKVRGAADMIHIQGAAMLAAELELLAMGLLNNQVKNKIDAAEVLAAGMLQLPGYLQSLYHGKPDIPLVLLPQLNDIRAAQDKELLTEGEFFFPDLSIKVPQLSDHDCLVSGDLPSVAKKLRPGYLSGLLGVIKDENTMGSLENLILVVDNLLLSSTTESAMQFWWIASGVIDSLYEGRLEASVAVKILLGRVDQQIKRVIDFGEQILTEQPPSKVNKNLLYYVAQSTASNERVIELKKAFGLDYPDNSAIAEAREGLYGFNVNLIDSISVQVKEEIAKIKDALDLDMRAKTHSSQSLEPVLQQFDTVADALGMLGMNTQQTLLREFKNFISPKIKQGDTLDDEDYMNVAAALLHIEASLSDLGATLAAPQTGSLLPQAEYEQLVKLVSQEIVNEINTLKQCINDFSINPSKPELLSEVPELLELIGGAMHIMRHELQANLAKAIHDFIKNELLGGHVEVNSKKFDQLADAITGLEYYYESMLEKSVAPEVGINIAQRSISQLGYPPKSSNLNNHSDSGDTLSVQLQYN